MKRPVGVIGVCLLLLAGPVALSDDPDERYYDPTLPKTATAIAIKPFAGETYAAEIPDTLDLAQHAGESTGSSRRRAGCRLF